MNIFGLNVIIYWIVFFSPVVAALELEEKLVNDIKLAKLKLIKAEARVEKERADYSKKIAVLQNELENMRRQTTTIRRASDEQVLGLDKIRDRVKKWNDQKIFQQYLITSFSEEFNFENGEMNESLNNDFSFLSESIRRVNLRMYPQWENSEVVHGDGRIVSSKTLQVGPVSWYLSEDFSRAGLAEETQDGIVHSVFGFGNRELKDIYQLYSLGSAEITFDPSLGRAIKLESERENLSVHLAKGGIWVIPILIFAVTAFIIAIYKFLQLAQTA